MERRLLPVTLDSFKPLREVVFERLREAILDGTLKPGERMMEVQLAEEMGVSRTPVREAIRKMELEGFAVMIPRKGAYVAGISLKDIADVFEVRASLEALAAGLAAERITDAELEKLERILVAVTDDADRNDLADWVIKDTEFHDIIYQASRNQRLIQIVNNLMEQIHRFRSTSLAFPGRMRIAVEEHKKLVEAISERDVAKARALAQEHVENAEHSMLETLESNGLLIDKE